MNFPKDPVSRQSRRLVEVSDLVPPKRGVRLWAFSYADLATFLGMKEDAVRQAVKRNTLDPASLASVCAFKLERLGCAVPAASADARWVDLLSAPVPVPPSIDD